MVSFKVNEFGWYQGSYAKITAEDEGNCIRIRTGDVLYNDHCSYNYYYGRQYVLIYDIRVHANMLNKRITDELFRFADNCEFMDERIPDEIFDVIKQIIEKLMVIRTKVYDINSYNFDDMYKYKDDKFKVRYNEITKGYRKINTNTSKFSIVFMDKTPISHTEVSVKLSDKILGSVPLCPHDIYNSGYLIITDESKKYYGLILHYMSIRAKAIMNSEMNFNRTKSARNDAAALTRFDY